MIAPPLVGLYNAYVGQEPEESLLGEFSQVRLPQLLEQYGRVEQCLFVVRIEFQSFV